MRYEATDNPFVVRFIPENVKHWVCSKGHELVTDDDYDPERPQMVNFDFGKEAKLGDVCPFCLIEFIKSHIPQMVDTNEEVKGELSGAKG